MSAGKRKQQTPSFVYTRELDLSRKDVDFWESRERVAVSVYNDCLGEALKRMRSVKNDPKYRESLDELYKAKAVRDKLSKQKPVPRKDLNAAKRKVVELRKALSDINVNHGYTEFDLHDYVVQAKHHFDKSIGIDEAQKLATRAFQAVSKVMYGDAKKVNFVSHDDGITIEGKSAKSTLRYSNGKVYFGAKHCFDIIKPRNINEQIYYDAVMSHRVKYIRVMRRTIRGKNRYYVQFILEGIPPRKDHSVGELNQRVGIDEGVSTAARSSNGFTDLAELAPGCVKDARQARILQRKMDRSKRATNPQNYNEDGTIRKGKKTWVYSNTYRKTKAKYQDACRKERVKRCQEHEILANETLTLGLDIVIEPMKMQALTKRSKKTTVNKHGRINSKGRYGKTIANRAPAEFVAILERKLKYYGGSLTKVDQWDFRASQYDHVANRYDKKTMNKRIIVVGGEVVQRDMYSAFLLEHALTDKKVNRTVCKKDFKAFAVSCQAEINAIKARGSPHLQWYVT